MKRILIAVMLVAARSFAAENPEAGKAEEAIKAVFARVDSCVAKSDWACLSELFAENATFSGPLSGAKIVKGRSEIIKAFEGMGSERTMKGIKEKHTVQNVRLIGQDRAFVDCSVEVSPQKLPEGMNPNDALQMWRSTALLAQKGNKWLLEDVRFYVLEPVRTPTTIPPPTAPPPTATPPPSATPPPTATPPPAKPAVPTTPGAPAQPGAAPKAG